LTHRNTGFLDFPEHNDEFADAWDTESVSVSLSFRLTTDNNDSDMTSTPSDSDRQQRDRSGREMQIGDKWLTCVCRPAPLFLSSSEIPHLRLRSR